MAGKNEYDLINDGVVLETIVQNAISQIKFATTIFKLIGNGVKTVQIERTDTSGTASATLIGYLESSVRL